MISKLMVWDEDRAQAVARMRRALDEYIVRGIETNLPFHRRCLRHPAFVAGDYDTGFIGREAAALAPSADADETLAAMLAATLDRVVGRPAGATAALTAEVPASSAPSAWRGGGNGWRD